VPSASYLWTCIPGPRLPGSSRRTTAYRAAAGAWASTSRWAGAHLAQNRAEKEQRVREGRTHAALVLDAGRCLGWCQFGSPGELPEIKSRRRYEQSLTTPPDWRITCFFTGKGLRRFGVADAALGGALAGIAGHCGGTVEGYPEETDDRTLSGSFLHTGPMAAFENHGFARTRLISPHRWVVTRTVDPV
jgi:hypothetical protein